ncbi:hypothetical protein ACFL6Y_10510, partial [Elusimicrobiota bacterium]
DVNGDSMFRSSVTMRVSNTLENAFVISTGTAVTEEILRVSTAGVLYAKGGATYGADLAEMYPLQGEAEPGDVLEFGKGSGFKVRVAKGTSANIIGIVSTEPGMTIGWNDMSKNKLKGHVPVALSGRVPVKVTAENGPIRAGDYLAPSSKPGYAMKATKTGRVIGIALESFAAQGSIEEGKILVFVNPHYWVAPNEFEELKEELKKIKLTINKR